MSSNDFITLFFLVAAVLIFFQLRSVLGRRTGNEKPPRDLYTPRDAAGPEPADAGKVVALKSDLQPTELHYSGGLGFRFRMRSAIVTRVDLAGSTEGFRVIVTFSDVFKVE